MNRLLAGLILLIAPVAVGTLPESSAPWKQLEPGLLVGEFESPKKSTAGDSKITLVRIDPQLFEFRLLSSDELGVSKRTAKEWSQKHDLVAVTNAGMYQRDGKTSVGYMKNFEYVNNRRWASRMKAVLAFNRLDASVPPVQIIDRRCQSLEKLKDKYHTLVQGIRMIGCKQKNVWNDADDLWSMAAFGMDREGHALLIFTQSPYSPHDFIEILLALPAGIESAMYLEGGTEASLYVSSGGHELEKYGTHGTGILGSIFGGGTAWPVPNVIGVVRRGQMRTAGTSTPP